MATRTYIEPDFNLVADYWVSPNTPALGAPDYTDIPVQKYVNSLTQGVVEPVVRMPINSVPTMNFHDIMEIPAGSSRYWSIVAGTWYHEGFPNEYWGCLVFYCSTTGAQLVHFP